VSAVNFVRGQTLNHGLFRVFCNVVQAQHNVLFYTKVPLLSCVQVLIRVREQRKEIEQFLRHGGSGVAEHLENEFIISLATFQIYSATSTLNTSIQGTAMNIIKGKEKMTAFTNKLSSCICLI